MLSRLLDEREFLSPFGIRSLSAVYGEHPYQLHLDGEEYGISYDPGESTSGIFGGNSNWRGPIWIPLNYLFIEALERYYHFYGDELKVECPTGSGSLMNLREVSREINRRLCTLFLPDSSGWAPWQGDDQIYVSDPHWRGLDALQRILPRGDRTRLRRLPSDRLDGADCALSARLRGRPV